MIRRKMTMIAFVSLALVIYMPCGDGFRLFNLTHVDFIKLPSFSCEGHTFIALVHSAPSHAVNRDVIRESWGKSEHGRAVFVLGSSSDERIEEGISREHETHGDILQGSFVDSYRNLSYKHLTGYRWANDLCGSVEVVLKTDDDVFVDVHQLPDFLREYGFSQMREPFFLCHVNEGMSPKRDGKWKVTEEEYPGNLYPDFCSGGAYVTNHLLLRKILKANPASYFWIDDVYLTGILPSKLSEEVHYFEWNSFFLHIHVQYTSEIMNTSFFTPELMVIYDMDLSKMKFVNEKAMTMKSKKVFMNTLIVKYKEMFRPRRLKRKEEL